MASLDIDALITAATLTPAPPYDLMARLTAAWVAERNSPELLPYEETLLEDAKTRLEDRMNTVLERAGIDMKTNFTLVIVQTEMERLKYLMRSYLRTRISKIDRFVLHYTRDELRATRLSALERHYALKHQAITERHLRASFLKEFSDSVQLSRLDDPGAAGLSMIDKPDLDKSVFCKVVKETEESIRLGDEQLDLTRGATFLIRYSAVKSHLADGVLVLV